jgi:spermidine synthase
MLGPMQAPEFIDEARTPAGELIRLTRESGHFVVRVDGLILMSSGAHHSEEHMAKIGCAGLRGRPDARVLVGGLGLGYTLRSALDEVGPRATVVVSELLEAVVTWNRGPVAHLAEQPLDDPRVRIEVGDLVAYIRSRPAPFDTLLLDVDCGPDSFSSKGNGRLYDRKGLALLRQSLRPGGALVVWSAYECPPFVQALRRAGFETRVVSARERGNRGARHTLYVGRRAAGGRSKRR